MAIDYLFLARVEVVYKQEQEDTVFCALLRPHHSIYSNCRVTYPDIFLIPIPAAIFH